MANKYNKSENKHHFIPHVPYEMLTEWMLVSNIRVTHEMSRYAKCFDAGNRYNKFMLPWDIININ